ncbi:MAG: galactose-1-phosphate uridylyltransferase [Planctomycetes bacterium]|nr:galactose-1-phosphate uridylyltransferase [Planctomycetota bacterium]MBM4079600.1 galactose-1-phosphate uridylyltransferase [Planctomycetota bacterium]
MPELRKDPILGRWVIIATERAKRPSDFKPEPAPVSRGFCPFCEGNEDKTPPEIRAYRQPGSRGNGPDWRIRVVPNKFPALQIEGDLDNRGDGIYDMMNGIGAHEVIIETPKHEVSLTPLSDGHVAEVLEAYRERLMDLKKDPRLACGMIFKNVGTTAGASLEHTHSQLIVTPIVPKRVVEEMDGAKQFYNFRGRCIFCDMIKQELRSQTRIVVSSDHFVAFEPYAARFPFETWVLPKVHSSHFEDLTEPQRFDLAVVLKRTLGKIEKALQMPPYNYIIHSAPFIEPSMKHFHWHFEIIPRLTKMAGFEWGTGFYINPVPPEAAAQDLRDVR